MSGKFVVVDTEYGPVKGITKNTVFGSEYVNFQKIPYMKQPVGKLRFVDAQPPEKWTEPWDATEELPAFCGHDFVTDTSIGQLDAMYINVYTKDVDPKKLTPVMVFIHGGGFVSGSSRTELYNPDFLLQKNIILVTFNYRLGIFGFMSLEDESLGIPGNAGLKDQTFALKWIKRNIQNFGGDPNNITIFGESAGGASVHFHTISNLSKGLFNRAIPMSGTALCKTWTVGQRRNFPARLARAVGWNGIGGEKEILSFLEEADPLKLVHEYDVIMTDEEKVEMNILFAFGPVIEPYITDNCFIPKDPVLMAREAWGNDIDILVGACSNEGLLMYFHAAMYNLDLNLFLKKFHQALPLELGLKYGDEKSQKYGAILKKLYYGCTEPSFQNFQGYFDFVADLVFWTGIERAAMARVGKNGKTYLYRFDVDLSLNLLKKLQPFIQSFPGACHADDLGYLFNTALGCKFSIESKEFDVIKRMVSIFTNFAINGNVDWEPITTTELPLKAMNITEDNNSFIEIPENERLAVWNEIYQKENCPLY
jgi:carboxylesterase type B